MRWPWQKKPVPAPEPEPVLPAIPVPEPVAFNLKAKPQYLCQTIGDKLAFICGQYTATYTREVGGSSQTPFVRLSLKYSTGDVVCGTGPTTEAAFAQLVQRIGGNFEFGT